jgi:hypothetical protein
LQLPRTLGSIPRQEKGRVITFQIAGIAGDANEQDFLDDCQSSTTATIGDARQTRILRRSRQPYLDEKILFVPMPLRYSCFDKQCETGKTCKGGRCVDEGVDPNKLPEYREDLLFGNTSTCFSVDTCLNTATLPALPVDLDKCIFSVPGPAPVSPLPPTALNVRAIFDSGFSKEVLDVETAQTAEEGYFVPDPTKPQQFQLAPGLCDLFHGQDTSVNPPKPTAHRITSLEVSAVCNSKTAFQPICTQELNKIVTGNQDGVTPTTAPPAGCTSAELAVSSSELFVLLEKTDAMKDFFSDDTITAALGLSLADPAFRTTKIAMRYLPKGKTADACGTVTDFTVPFELADAARNDVVRQLKLVKDDPSQLAPSASERLNLDGAMGDAFKLLRSDGGTYNKRALLILGNQDFAPHCGATNTEDVARTAFNDADPLKKVSTYVVQFGPRTAQSDAAKPIAEKIARAGSGDKIGAFDARGTDSKNGFDAFYQVVGDLGACVYDAPKSVPGDGDTLSYYDPVKLTTTVVKFNAACLNDTNAQGFAVDSAKRVRMCGTACNDLRDALKASAAFAAKDGKTPPGIPVFARTGCK